MPTFFLGTLTRFYAENGGVGDLHRETDVEVIAGAVSAWRHWINKQLPHSLDWDESPTAPLDRAEVGEAAWNALCQAADNPQISAPSLWLPGAHDFLFKARDLQEREIWIGSSTLLQTQLEILARLQPELAPVIETIIPLARRSAKFNLPLAIHAGTAR